MNPMMNPMMYNPYMMMQQPGQVMAGNGQMMPNPYMMMMPMINP